MQHFSFSTYYRYILSSTFKDIDKIIYLDSDLVVLGDIAELYSINIKDKYLAVVKDILYKSGSTRLGLDNYFSAGVLLMNLDLLRKDHIEEKLITISRKVKLLYNDQDSLNIICGSNVEYIDHGCNNAALSDRHFLELTGKISSFEIDHPKIIHYISGLKPWNESYPFERGNFYYKYLKYTPWKYFYLFNIKSFPKKIFIT